MRDRLRSQQNLYRLVLERLDQVPPPHVLEIGCGRGAGAALACTDFDFDRVTAVDLHPSQIERARGDHDKLMAARAGRLSFRVGAADALPVADAEVDGVFLVESPQHFPSLVDFARQAWRVLRPGGRLSLATFFATAPEAGSELARLLDTFASGLDRPHLLTDLEMALTSTGFSVSDLRAIGADVWPGFDLWLAQTEFHDQWPRNFLRAYQSGLLDYYLVTAIRPE